MAEAGKRHKIQTHSSAPPLTGGCAGPGGWHSNFGLTVRNSDPVTLNTVPSTTNVLVVILESGSDDAFGMMELAREFVMD